MLGTTPMGGRSKSARNLYEEVSSRCPSQDGLDELLEVTNSKRQREEGATPHRQRVGGKIVTDTRTVLPTRDVMAELASTMSEVRGAEKAMPTGDKTGNLRVWTNDNGGIVHTSTEGAKCIKFLIETPSGNIWDVFGLRGKDPLTEPDMYRIIGTRRLDKAIKAMFGSQKSVEDENVVRALLKGFPVRVSVGLDRKGYHEVTKYTRLR